MKTLPLFNNDVDTVYIYKYMRGSIINVNATIRQN